MSERKAKEKQSKNPDNLFQRGDVWWIRYNVGGEKVRYSLNTRSQREAKRLRDQILAKRSVSARLGLEAPVPKKERSFGEVLDLWLEWRRGDSSLSKRTLKISERHAKIWLRPYFGRMLMSEITVEDIEGYLAHLRKTGNKRKNDKRVSEAYVGQIFGGLRMVYRQAIKRDWYHGPNPIDKLDRKPRKSRSRDVTLTEDEAGRLLGKLTGELRYKVALALATGLRWGEVYGLAWMDIVLDSSPPTLTVRRSYQGAPKSEESAATIPLNDDAAALLRRWRSLQGAGARYVFPDRRGELRMQRRCSDDIVIKDAAEQAGIAKNVTPHVFRHTFGTWVYERTGDPKLVQRLLRHASFTTSMGYVHDRRELGEVVNRLPRLTTVELKAA
jgi:integrase/recombinase XerD